MKKLLTLLFFLAFSGMLFAQTYPLVTIEDIQYQHPDSLIANGDDQERHNPLFGDTVRVQGVVMVAPVVNAGTDRRRIHAAGNRWMIYMVDPNGNQHEFFDGIIPIQHDTTGVNQNTFFDLVDTADVVEFTVVVEEFFTTTQVALLVNPPTSVSIVGNLGSRPAPIEVDISEFVDDQGNWNPLSEKYEGQYVIVRNAISSDRDLGNGTFRLNDGQGNSILMYDQSGYFTLRGHRLTGITDYQPPVDGSNITFIRGFIQTHSDLGARIAPAYPGDIEVATLPSGFLGDVNGDDNCNSTDALIILSFDVGLPIPPDFLDRINTGFGDVNSDGLTNSTDALILLSFDVGIPVPFPVCESFTPPVAATAYEEPTTKNIGN
ncbi:MAG: hypothetical protein IIC76_03200 [Bacteroidetes bacterium]|nr:hypothetical protein [Bacteroidota bacterium]